MFTAAVCCSSLQSFAELAHTHTSDSLTHTHTRIQAVSKSDTLIQKNVFFWERISQNALCEPCWSILRPAHTDVVATECPVGITSGFFLLPAHAHTFGLSVALKEAHSLGLEE